MQSRYPDPDRDVLPQPVAERLLARASLLDATDLAGSRVSALRAAALEAGISERAFDAALAELRAGEPARATGRRDRPRHPVRMWAGVATLVVALVGVSRLVAPSVPAEAAPVAGMIEESVLLQCLATNEAIDLIRPILRLPTNATVGSQGSRVITITATPGQMKDVKSVLDRYEGASSTACALPAPPPA